MITMISPSGTHFQFFSPSLNISGTVNSIGNHTCGKWQKGRIFIDVIKMAKQLILK